MRFFMIDNRFAPWGLLILRVVLGGLFLFHAGVKIFVFTPAGTAEYFSSLGLPAALAYIAIAWELAGGVALIVGLWPRMVAVAMVPLLLGTIVSAHGANGFMFSNEGGGWEYPAFWIVALVVQALCGNGAAAWQSRATVVAARTKESVR
tara:strand:+ start:160 stop:606 length:447 start_codon:yes stop_codon:yes gene_type:complete